MKSKKGKKMCDFCKIANKQLAAHVVYENDTIMTGSGGYTLRENRNILNQLQKNSGRKLQINRLYV